MQRIKFIVCCLIICNIIGIRASAQMRQVYNDVADNNIKKISFYSPSSGFAAFTNWIGSTTDSGRTFTKKYISIGNVDYNGYGVNLTFGFGISGVIAFDQNKIIVYGDYGLVPSILSSTDGGSTFKLVYHSQYNQFALSTGITDMVFPQNTTVGYAIDADRILKTSDGGLTWYIIRTDPGSFFEHLEAIDNYTLFVFNSVYNGSKLLRTSDAGSNWQQILLPANDQLYYASFITSDKGWINTYTNNNSGHNIYYTSTGGTNWIQKNDNSVFGFSTSKMKFVNDSTGYAIAGLYTTLVTTDSGKIWERVPRDNNYSYLGYTHNDLHFRSATQFWAGGGHGFLELTTNGGGTPIPSALFKIDTTNESATHVVNLVNYSKKKYQYQWIKNDTLISTSYNTSYTRSIYKLTDTVKLVVTYGGRSDTAIKYIYFSPPVIVSSFTPASAGAGAAITIKGSNFNGAAAVYFGNTAAASFTVKSDTIITAVVGVGASGSVTVSKYNGSGSLAGFTFVQPPVINSISPVNATAGATVIISGNYFTGAASVSFGDIAAASFTVNSPSSITAVVGSGKSGGVKVTTPGGTATFAGFGMLPVISSFTPLSGTTGTVLTITGTGFLDATGVTVGGVPAQSFSIKSATSITAVVGATASGNVVVSTASGNYALPGFTFYQPPVITNVSPLSGPVGTTVTITGSNFSAVAANNIVYFGAVKAVVNAATATSLTVTVPVGAAFEPVIVTVNNLLAYSPRAFLVTFANGGSITDNSFSQRQDFSTAVLPNYPYGNSTSVTAGDLDGDGKNDLLVTNQAAYTMSVYRNTSTSGSISFATKIEYAAGDEPVGTAIGDIDGDGKKDVAVINMGQIMLYRNTSAPGNISLTLMLTLDAPGSSVTFNDVDGDGKADMVTNSGTIFRNISNPGSFGFDNAINLGIGGDGIIVIDMDGDSKPDIVTSEINVLRNTSTIGNISFTKDINVVVGSNSYDVAVGDIDGDGKPDIASVIADDYRISILRNTSTPGSLSFAAKLDVLAPSPVGVDINDLDGDGKPDLYICNYIANTISVYKNLSTSGNINLATRVDFASGGYPQGNSSVDIDGDGKADIVITNVTGNSVSVYRNKVVAEPFIISFTPTMGKNGTQVVITGYNFTGVTGVSFGGVAAASFVVNSATQITAKVGAGAAGKVVVTNSYGSGSKDGFVFDAPPTVTSFTPASGPAGTVVTITGTNFHPTASYNVVRFGGALATVTAASATSLTVIAPYGSMSDVITVTNLDTKLSANSSVAFIYSFPGNNLFDINSFAARITQNTFGGYGALADMDNDGKLDIVSAASAGTIIARNKSNGGNISFDNNFLAAPTIIGKTTVADFNSDGKPDIALISASTTVSVIKNNSTPGALSFASKLDLTTDDWANALAVGDIDGDGKPDIVTANYSNSSMSVLKNSSTSGNISFLPKTDYALPQYGSNIFLTDLDGDKKPEVIATTTSSLSFSVFLNTSVPGTISFAPVTNYSSGTGSLDITDLDGDGKMDIVILQGTNCGFYRNISTAGSLQFAARVDFPIGSSVAGNTSHNDLNGDGKIDLFSSTATSNVFINNSTAGNGALNAPVSFPLNATGNNTTSGDLDGDGKPDVVAFHSGILTTILRNQVGGFSPVIQSFTPVNALAGDTVVITGANFSNATAVGFGGTSAVSFIIVNDNIIEAVVGTGSSGTLTVTSPAGTSSRSGFGYNAALALSSISPSKAVAGTNVTLIGAHLDNVKSVRFGGVDASSFSIVSSSKIIATTAANSLSGNVSVLNQYDSATIPGFVFYRPPVIDSVSPATATINATVTIYGKYFTDASYISFGDIQPASYKVVNDTTITTVNGGGATGVVKVITPGGIALKDKFTYLPYLSPASLTSFYPASGTIGTAVIIKGNYFTNVVEVKFGGTAASSFTINSPTQITAIVADGTSGNIAVRNANGTTTIAGFTYVPPTKPVILSFSPSVAIQGTTVNITGFNLSNVFAVKFGTTAASSFTINSPTSITAVVGNGSTGNVSAYSGPDTALLAGFVYSTVPYISSFFPEAAAPGTLVSIRGGNFNSVASGNIVYFGGVRATVISASSALLLVQVPVGARYSQLSVTSSNLTGYSSQKFIPVFASSGTVDAATFAVKIDSSTGAAPVQADLADLDTDGKPDLCMGIGGSTLANRNITIFPNNSTPGIISFAPKYVNVNSPYTATRVALADFNGDGVLDFSSSESGDMYAIVVNKNNSTPSSFAFGSSVVLQSGIGPFRLAAGDLDCDGKPDEVSTSYYSSPAVFRNTSTASTISFAARQSFGSMTSPVEILMNDIDMDGKQDLLVTSGSGTGTVAFLKNTSTPGSLSFTSLPSFGTTSRFVEVADIDRDGKPDIITVGYDSGYVYVYRNISTPGYLAFEAQRRFNCSPQVTGLALGDLNGDGKIDIVTTNNLSNTVDVLINKSSFGYFNFDNKISYPTSCPASSVSIGDVDGDGKPEIILANGSSNSVSILKNQLLSVPTGMNICPVNQATITSNITGTAYQWQVDTGNGFKDIHDAVKYSNYNTGTLQLNAPSSQWYGYVYRCRVDEKKYSAPLVLDFANSWTGAISNAWEEPGNWSCNRIPDANTDVIINSGNIVLSSNGVCRSIAIRNNATFNINGSYTLTLTH